MVKKKVCYKAGMSNMQPLTIILPRMAKTIGKLSEREMRGNVSGRKEISEDIINLNFFYTLNNK